MRRLPRLRVVGGQGSGKNAVSDCYEGSRGRGVASNTKSRFRKAFSELLKGVQGRSCS